MNYTFDIQTVELEWGTRVVLRAFRYVKDGKDVLCECHVDLGGVHELGNMEEVVAVLLPAVHQLVYHS